MSQHPITHFNVRQHLLYLRRASHLSSVAICLTADCAACHCPRYRLRVKYNTCSLSSQAEEFGNLFLACSTTSMLNSYSPCNVNNVYLCVKRTINVVKKHINVCETTTPFTRNHPCTAKVHSKYEDLSQTYHPEQKTSLCPPSRSPQHKQ